MKDEVYLKMLGAAVWESPVPIYVIHLHIMPAGTPGYCLASIRNFDKTLCAESEPGTPMEQAFRHLARENAILQSLCLDYTVICFADLKTDTIEIVKQGCSAIAWISRRLCLPRRSSLIGRAWYTSAIICW